jgi:hypothetical protein
MPIMAAAVALVAGLLVVVFGNELGTLLYAATQAGIGVFAVLLIIIFPKYRQQRIKAVAVFGAFVGMTTVLVVNQAQLRPRLFWILWSHRYKSKVLAQPASASAEFKHIEWEGDGAATGDWMGYVVYDPKDSLSAAIANPSTTHEGIPCKIAVVRRLEKQWYSVVLEMNQFWDPMHPAC